MRLPFVVYKEKERISIQFSVMLAWQNYTSLNDYLRQFPQSCDKHMTQIVSKMASSPWLILASKTRRKILTKWCIRQSCVRRSDVLMKWPFDKPIISARIIHFQVEQINNRVALTVVLFILKILVEQIKFQCIHEEIWPSPTQLIFLTVDNVKSFTQALTYTSSVIHGIPKDYLNTDSHL